MLLAATPTPGIRPREPSLMEASNVFIWAAPLYQALGQVMVKDLRLITDNTASLRPFT